MQVNQLKLSIQESMKASMRAQEKDRLAVIRLILSEIKQKEIDERIELDETQTLAIFDKMIKQRKDSISQYEAAQRDDLVKQERFEIEVIQSLMPPPLSHEEVQALIEKALQDTAATTIRDMSKVMALLKPQLQGRTDVTAVSEQIKNRLNQPT